MIVLNEDQEKAAEKIVDFIEGKLDIPHFTLTGGPGTGKTVMLKEALSRTHRYIFDRSAAAVAHAAKNVLSNAFEESIPCYTVAQWLGMKMSYSTDGDIVFKSDGKIIPKLTASKIAILDEASMINDSLYYEIMNIVHRKNIKLIIIGDVRQLPPVKQDHDSRFFDRIDAELTIPMRFLGPITEIASVYKNAIDDINNGYIGDPYILNHKTNRIDKTDISLDSGYFFKNNIYEIVEQVGSEIKENSYDLNYSRILAYKNDTVDLLNKNIRQYIYGNNANQFEKDEILISRGGFTVNKSPVIHNGALLRVEDMVELLGPYDIPCLSIKFKNFNSNHNIVAVKDDKETAIQYNKIKIKLLEYAKRDPKQWTDYYKFIDSFAYFDYASSVNAYKAQGQTLKNVYVLESEIMSVKPLSLKQKFQALYVAMTRASQNLYIYNKNH